MQASPHHCHLATHPPSLSGGRQGPGAGRVEAEGLEPGQGSAGRLQGPEPLSELTSLRKHSKIKLNFNCRALLNPWLCVATLVARHESRSGHRGYLHF